MTVRCGNKKKRGGKDDSKSCGLSTRKDGGAIFRAKDFRRQGRFKKEGLGEDRCSKVNFFEFV